MSVSSLGVGSGLDLESLVQNMISVQRDTKVSLYESKISDYKAQVSGYGTILSTLKSFQEVAQKLNDASLFTGRSVELTQPSSGDIVSVSADETASNGSYNIAVEQIAQGSRSVSAQGLFSTQDDVVSTTDGVMTFTAGSQTFDLNVTGGTTLSELRNQINSASNNFGVSANLIDDGAGNVYLAITSDETGDGNSLSISNNNAEFDNVSSVATGAGPAGLSVAPEDEAQNAIIQVDGISITSATNSFSDAVSGLTIDVLAESQTDSLGNLETAKSTVSFDQETMEDVFNEFVESYNNMRSMFEEAGSADSVFSGSSLVRNLKNQLASNLMVTFSNTGNFTSMFDVGFELEKDGKISLDSDKLSDAVNSDFDSISKIFSGDEGLSVEGLGSIFDDYLSIYTDTGGLLKDLSDSSQERADAASQDLENFEYRMELYESQLRDQFSSLDVLLASMNSNGSALLASLQGLSSSSS